MLDAPAATGSTNLSSSRSDTLPTSTADGGKSDKPANTLAGYGSYRPDIDGLRGFGALLVLLFHFRETWSDASYKGADLTNSTFFAVSGFVITLSVLRARAKNPTPINLRWTGGFALVFLFRRLQRLILPQLLVIVVTVVVFCGSQTPSLRLVSLLQTAKYSVVGGANVYFGTQEVETQYVGDKGTTTDMSLSKNPLMHMWYLGVEEQVYLMYPWVFAAAHVLSTHHPAGAYIVFGAVFTLSLACACTVDMHGGPGFFLLQYRGWEVLVGVLTCHALIVSRMFWDKAAEDDQFRRRALIWPQLAFVMLETTAGLLYQYPEYSLVATICGLLGTVVFFIAGHGFDWKAVYPVPLSKTSFHEVPMLNYIYGLSGCAYFGRISYAVYLWHFPINVLCADHKEAIQQVVGTTDAAAFFLQFLLILVLSIFTHHFIENPFRYWRVVNYPTLPALSVVLMAGGLELWLFGVYGRMVGADLSNVMRPHGMELPPLFGKLTVGVFLTAIVIPALMAAAWRISTTTTPSLTLPSQPLLLAAVLFPLGVYIGRASDSDLMAVSQRTPLTLTQSIGDVLSTVGVSRLDDVSTVPEYYGAKADLYSWRHGTHSFASNGCACRASTLTRTGPRWATAANATNATGATSLPLCFDVDRWASVPYEKYNYADEDCNGAQHSTYGVERLWQDCRVPGRTPTDGSARETSTAFVFGPSTAHGLRFAVAGAIGGEYAIVGFSLVSFAQPELLQLISLNHSNATDGARIRFDGSALAPLTNSVMGVVAKFDARVKKLRYVQKLAKLLDKHLGRGDLIFYSFQPYATEECTAQAGSQCESHAGVDYFCCHNGDGLHGPQKAGLARLGALAQARGATLVLTTGVYTSGNPSHKHIDLARWKASPADFLQKSSAKFRKDALRAEMPLLEVAAAGGGSVIHWSFGPNLCGPAHCSNLIPGTQNHAIVPAPFAWHHPTLEAEAYVAPFLCDFLKKNELLQPIPHAVKGGRQYRMRFAHDQLEVDMAALVEGQDQYMCRVFRLPAHLRRGAITQIAYDFEPKSHKRAIHHMVIRSCTGFPSKHVSSVEEPFACKGGDGAIHECATMTWVMGMETPPINFPKLPTGEQVAVPLNTEFMMLEVHYKAPNVDSTNDAALRQEMQRLRQANTVVDSSGLSVTLMSQDGAQPPFKFVQILELGPRSTGMLHIPPGVTNAKVTNVCPSECFAAAMEAAKVPHIEVLSVMLHAHTAATAMFGEVVDLRTKETTVFSGISDYQSNIDNFKLLETPVRVTPNHALRVTCVYDTLGRRKLTQLGESLEDEMCFMYTLISPPLQDFHECWHLDNGASRLKLGARSRTNTCRAQCGSLTFPEFKLPRGSSRWPSAVSEGDQGWHKQGGGDLRTSLDGGWPGAPVCEL